MWIGYYLHIVVLYQVSNGMIRLINIVIIEADTGFPEGVCVGGGGGVSWGASTNNGMMTYLQERGPWWGVPNVACRI